MNLFTSSIRRGACLLGCSMGLPLGLAGAEDAPAERPNILFIFTDDQRWDSIGYINPYIHTPNIDRFAAEGLRFNQATIVLPVCSPSRAAALTGRYGLANGVTTFHNGLREGETTFFKPLKEAGYLTAMIGKWHVLPVDAPYGGFRGFMTALDQPFPPVFHEFDEVRDAGNSRNYWQPEVVHNGEWTRAPGTSLDYVVDETIAVIRQAVEDGRSFAVYCSTLEPHNRMWGEGQDHLSESTVRYYEEHPLDTLPWPPNIHDDLSGKPPYLQVYRGRVNRVGARNQNPMTPERFRDAQYRIYAMMSEVDIALGRLFDALETLNLRENTYVVLMGDNGLFDGEHGLMSKGLHYEASVRVPLFIVGPGIRPGFDDRSLPTNVDIAPTLLELAGLVVPANMHGDSLKQAAKERIPLDRAYVLLEHPDENTVLETRTAYSLRSREWKYIRTYENGKDEPYTFEELYDLFADPYELNNIADDPDQAERMAFLRVELDRQRQRVRR